jgi:hypothetical protein
MNKKHDTETSELERKVRTAWSNRETATDAEQLRLIDAVKRTVMFLDTYDRLWRKILGKIFERMYMTDTNDAETLTDIALSLRLSRSSLMRHRAHCARAFCLELEKVSKIDTAIS